MKRLSLASLALAFFFCAGGEAQTNIAIGTTTLQSGVKPMGINLGQSLQYGSNQIMANIINANPGFGNTKYNTVIYCSSATSTSCSAYNTGYTPSGFWPTDGSVSVYVMTGAATGLSTTITSLTGSNVYGFSSSLTGLAAGDYVEFKKTITPGVSGYVVAQGWNTSGYAPTGSYSFAYSSDAPVATNGSTYTSSLLMTATGTAAAYLTATVDSQLIPWLSTSTSFVNQSFIDLNGTYVVTYSCKAISGSSPQIFGTVSRSGASSNYLTFTDTCTTSWQQFTHTFSASETGVQNPGITVGLATVNAESVEITNYAMTEQGTGGNTTPFRNGVYQALMTLKPGVLRMWDQQGLTTSVMNMLVDQFARVPVNFSTGPPNGAPGYYDGVSYGVPDFLQLCQAVGAEPWITMPITTTPTEAALMIDYLSGGSGTTGGALRIAQGFTTPWTTIFAGKKIHLELGNEVWNGTFEGGSMEYGNNPTYGAYWTYGNYAQTIFAAMKADSNYVGSVMSLVLSGQFANTGAFMQVAQNACNNNDEIDVGPYMDGTLTDASSTANIWQPGLAEPQVFWQPGAASGASQVCAEFIGNGSTACPSQAYFTNGGAQYAGGMKLAQIGEANATRTVPIAVYEENNGSYSGSFTQAQFWAYDSAWGAGLEQASEFLTNVQNGVLTQNLYEFGEYFFAPNGGGSCYMPSPTGVCVYIWGSVVDTGPTNRRRPQFLVETAINSAITYGATMLTTTQTGSNPTFSVGNTSSSTTVNTVATSSVYTIQSFAFNNGGGSYSLILLNLDISNTQAVTFSGANAPTGTVTQIYLNSTNLSDTNESSNLISPVTSTLTSPAGLTMQPHSMYVLTWGGGSGSPNVTLSSTSLTFSATNISVTSAPQTITLTNNGTANLTISAIGITGTNAGDFGQTNTCGTLPATIPYSGSNTCVFTVTFAPTALGSRAGTLSITDNASGSPHTASLTGTGTAAYYVSNSGSDSAAGTSAAPWQTVAKVNSTTLVPGATVSFAKGGLWREQLTASSSGTSGNPISYGNYGSGALPIIDGGNLVSWTNVSGNVWSTTTSTTAQTCHASSTCLQFPNFSGTVGIPVASQAAVTAANDYYFDGVTTLYVYSVGSPASTVEVPTRNYGMDLGGQSYISVSGLQLQSALYYGLNCQSSSTGCSNLALSGNTATLNTSNGISLLSTTAGQRMTTDTISTNTANYNGSSGIKIGGYWQALTDSGNTASYNCIVPSSSAYYDNQFCGGLYFYGMGSTADGTYSGTFNASEGSGSTFSGDTASYNGQNGGSNTNIGNGLWLDTLTNITATSETAFGNLNNQVYAEKTIGSVFRHNLGYGGGSNTVTGCFVLAAGQTLNSKNNLVLENTCDGGYSALLTNFETSTGVMVGNTFQNNIFYQHTGSGIAYLSYVAINTITGSGGGTGNVFQTNGFGAPRSNFIYYNSAFYSTYGAFETAFGGSTNSMQLDPALVNPPTSYALTSGSPARGAGTTYSGYPPYCSGATNPDLGYLPYTPCSSTPIYCCLHP